MRYVHVSTESRYMYNVRVRQEQLIYTWKIGDENDVSVVVVFVDILLNFVQLFPPIRKLREEGHDPGCRLQGVPLCFYQIRIWIV